MKFEALIKKQYNINIKKKKRKEKRRRTNDMAGTVNALLQDFAFLPEFCRARGITNIHISINIIYILNLTAWLFYT